MLSGGGALLAGLDVLITQITGIRAMVAKNPLDSVAIGIGHVIENDTDGINYRNRYKGV